jgi:hypothetical protein
VYRGTGSLGAGWSAVMTAETGDVLDWARRRAGLSHSELWLRYFELGGMSTALQLEAFVDGLLEPTVHDHDLVAHALNERFVELGGNHPVPYLEDRPQGPQHDN